MLRPSLRCERKALRSNTQAVHKHTNTFIYLDVVVERYLSLEAPGYAGEICPVMFVTLALWFHFQTFLLKKKKKITIIFGVCG